MAYSYLALGDSYTIGESVPLQQNFPYQTVQLLRKNNIEVYAPEIIAATGWTTDELNNTINNTVLLKKYDFVSLLIGVNNQYRGRSLQNYAAEFDALLKRAANFSRSGATNIFVLSIPDWGITPFAKERDARAIAKEIDDYNAAAEHICSQHDIFFTDITTAQRKDNGNEGFVAGDGLHPSAKEYAKWAIQLSEAIKKRL